LRRGGPGGYGTGVGPGTTTFEDWQLVFLSPWGSTGMLLASAAVVVALVLSALSLRRQRSWWRRALLLGLRIVAVAAVLLLVLQPAAQLRNVTLVPNHVAVLLDLSRSMAVREGKDQPTRLERAAALLARSRTTLRRWGERRIVEQFGFGASVKAVGVDRPERLKATEPATRIWSALAKLRQIYQRKDLAAIVLISDGLDNGRFGSEKVTPAGRRFLVGLETPVHTVWVGSPTIRDVAVNEVYSDAFAFVRNAVQVEADVSVFADDIRQLPVALETRGATVAQRQIHLKPGQSRYRVRFDFVPQRVGKFVYTVSTPVLAGEALAGNNRRSFVLKVIRDRIRVLQVCGRPSWDERFLRQLLKRDPNIDLISFFILRTPTDLSLVPTSELSLIPFPTEDLFEKELGSFDLVVLQNFNYGPYGIGVYLPHLRRFVEEGGGLAMIGGSLSFSSGGYQETPLAEILPVALLPASSDPSRLISEEDFRPRLTREGQDHPILQVAATAQQTQQTLAALPVLTGVNLVASPAPGATALAVHPALKGTDGKPMPVLATREVGKGRTLALTTDTSWHWAFHSVGAGGTRQAYDRFWRNAIRWLIRDPELRYLRVIPQRDTVRLGAPVRAVVRAYNPDYSPAHGVKVRYEVRRLPDGVGSARETHTNNEGEVQLDLVPTREGAYRIAAEATIGGRRNQESALVLVEPVGPEEREVRATPALLKQVAEATGGRYLGQVGALPDLQFRQPRAVRVNWRRDVELWSRWWSLLVCLLALGLEWTIRRRFGYL
jgi:uncharacterized membrane protein